jgi:hypothetical protein
MNYAQYPRIEFRRKFWKFFGAEISLTDPTSDQLIGFIKMKAWKLREDIRLYTDRSMRQEVIHIQARQIIDFGATYDVFDSASGQLLFSLRRKGLKSTFVRDHWDILDPAGTQTGYIQETSGTLALLRRWLSLFSDLFDLIFAFTAQTYDINITTGGAPSLAAHITHRKNPFVVKMALDTTGAQAQADPRLTIAAGALLSVIDAAKNN